MSLGREYVTIALMPSSESIARTDPTVLFASLSFTLNSYGVSTNSGFLSLMSVTLMLTVAVLDKPPVSSALINWNKTIHHLLNRPLTVVDWWKWRVTRDKYQLVSGEIFSVQFSYDADHTGVVAYGKLPEIVASQNWIRHWIFLGIDCYDRGNRWIYWCSLADLKIVHRLRKYRAPGVWSRDDSHFDDGLT